MVAPDFIVTESLLLVETVEVGGVLLIWLFLKLFLSDAVVVVVVVFLTGPRFNGKFNGGIQ